MQAPESDGAVIAALRRLQTGWIRAAERLDLLPSSRYSDISVKIKLDRGTAQRLVKMSRLDSIKAGDLMHFPGVRAWGRVLSALKVKLGARSAELAELSDAVALFTQTLRQLGGSKSAAIRELNTTLPTRDMDGSADLQAAPFATSVRSLSRGGAGQVLPLPWRPDSLSATASRESLRAAQVAGFADTIGYIITLRSIATFQRPSPTRPGYYDVAIINMLRGCLGRSDALPLVMGSTFRRIQSGKSDEANPLELLHAGTNKPPPRLIQTDEQGNQTTIFVEPCWTNDGPLNIAFLSVRHEAFVSPWDAGYLNPDYHNRHPTNAMVIEAFVQSDFADACTVSLKSYRCPPDSRIEKMWFNRLRDKHPMERLNGIEEAKSREVFPGYRDVMAEGLERLGWDCGNMVGYRSTIQHPIPLATYSLLFEIDNSRPRPGSENAMRSE